jgi:tRNA threonylcarbamoyladenosine biosynthesis protein TsaB
MAVLLHIDTATEHASVSLSRNGEMLRLLASHEQKNHAAFVQPAIQQLLKECGLSLHMLDAVSVTAGPGSYTGLRVGYSSAKGICYALGKPLIAIGTLDVMYRSMCRRLEEEKKKLTPDMLFAPLIDARRMEVFTAVYRADGTVVSPMQALVLTEQSFQDLMTDHPLLISGSGAAKTASLLQHPSLITIDVQHNASDMLTLAEKAFENRQFADLAYSEPDYGKAFFTPGRSH